MKNYKKKKTLVNEPAVQKVGVRENNSIVIQPWGVSIIDYDSIPEIWKISQSAKITEFTDFTTIPQILK